MMNGLQKQATELVDGMLRVQTRSSQSPVDTDAVYRDFLAAVLAVCAWPGRRAAQLKRQSVIDVVGSGNDGATATLRDIFPRLMEYVGHLSIFQKGNLSHFPLSMAKCMAHMLKRMSQAEDKKGADYKTPGRTRGAFVVTIKTVQDLLVGEPCRVRWAPLADVVRNADHRVSIMEALEGQPTSWLLWCRLTPRQGPATGVTIVAPLFIQMSQSDLERSVAKVSNHLCNYDVANIKATDPWGGQRR
jgi:hypothetical protein